MGTNSNNTHFNFIGIKNQTLKKKNPKSKNVQGVKVKCKILWYLILPSLDNIKHCKKQRKKSTAKSHILTQ